ncbi:hypothetical protein [Pontibacter harenae]|uniref:hypothetical protein n=1 Tax=Pontibacter harenae TaxID=2894083 RepID=UPI001E500ED8|nr:hypothetical protein [Pontibacter harenae]MCC9167877.1 hypothetical protein [Pontibacter harenae]
MKHFYCLLLLCILSTGCVSINKYTSFVNEQAKSDANSLVHREWLTVNLPAVEAGKNKVTKVKGYFIPAIFYFSWNNTIACELDPYVAATYIRKGIYQAADSLEQNNHLDGKKLVINLQQVPGQFMYENKGQVFNFIFFRISSGNQTIAPQPIALQATYELKLNDGLVINGSGSIPNTESLSSNGWLSAKRLTWAHLDNFKTEAERMGSLLVREIIAQQNRDSIHQ